jgi:hypothetical protein
MIIFSNSKSVKISDLNSRLRLIRHWGMLFILLFISTLSYSQITSAANGNWGATATWVGGVVPGAGANVIINHNVTVNVNTAVVNNITINAGSLSTTAISPSTLSYSGDMVVNNNASLSNYGGIVQTALNKTFALNNTATYIHNPANNTLLDESIFTKSNEVFSQTSNLTIMRWFDMSVPLGEATKVQSSDFGNVTLSVPDTIAWEQNGEFMQGGGIQRVYGTLTVTSGTISMDDGTVSGGTTFLQLSNVVINGTGRIIFSSGPSRPYTLQTGSFTDQSTAVNPTVIMNNCFGLTIWNANGQVTLGHNFYGIIGTGVNPGGDLRIQVNGNLNINGTGDVRFVTKASAPLQLTVNGNTVISGNPTFVRFIDGNLGDLTYITNDLTISGGGSNTLMGGNGLVPQATGTPNITINNNLTVNGLSNSTILDASTSIKKLRLKVGGSFIMSGTNSNFTGARSKGAFTLAVGGDINHTAGKFIGQIDTLNTAIDSVIVNGNHTMNCLATSSDYFRINYGDGNTFYRCLGAFNLQNSGTGQGIGFSGVYAGRGNMHFQVLGNFTMLNGRFSGIYGNRPGVEVGSLTFITGVNYSMSAGFFRGIDSRVEDTPATITFTTGNLSYSGGNFSGYYSSNNNGSLATFAVNGLLQITFTNAATDSFAFIGFTNIGSFTSSLRLAVTVSGNFNITGPAGSFISSLANGRETFSVTGSVNISGGKNSFDSYPASNLANAHPVILTIGSDFAVNGGITYLSANNDSVVANVTGNLSVTNGELILQYGNTPGEMTVLGGYTQTGGTFYLHKNSTELSYSPITVTINSDDNTTGDFSQTGGTINFDNNTTSTTAKLVIKSPNVTYGGTGSMTMANPGTNAITAVVSYAKTGNINFNRTATTHSIQQVEQHIETGCTLTVMTGDLQIASLNVITTNMLFIASGATLDLKGSQVFSNALQANSGFKSSGRIRLTRTQGFYNGTATAAISSTGAMNFFLLSNSVVEYYGTETQVVTGIGVGLATAPFHKYYNLEINFQGTANTKFVYPTNVPNTRSVFVRNKLILTSGELNLDNDHDPASGGRSIIIERDSITAITRTAGYIRSEVYDSTASVIWKIGSRSGPHVFPFGYNATSYIPFTFDLPAGNTADTVIVSTYHTPTNNNQPYPSGVQHVNNFAGTDNSLFTVDRFWYLEVSGTTPTANLSFVCTTPEMTGITSPRAQCWIPVGWQYPYQGSQSNPFTGTQVNGANYFPNNWWTLAGLATPLPISLLDFTGSCNENNVELKWQTASEINNDFFTLLKSTDGFNYEIIGTVDGANNSSSILSYSFTDTKNITGEYAYYKLRQTDNDGTQNEFGPVLVKACLEVSNFSVHVIPDTQEDISIIIENSKADKYLISLFNLEGKPLKNMTQSLGAGVNIVPLHTGTLSSALYIVRVQSSDNTVTKKIHLGFFK